MPIVMVIMIVNLPLEIRVVYSPFVPVYSSPLNNSFIGDASEMPGALIISVRILVITPKIRVHILARA